ncbi:MAG: UDP-glucose 4-epimerase GalE [Crocinitomicaceae bacterium]|nr:UDP-glucose 4-epimerase GalE [Crocinitomicaceae bacterium]|tara:strand:+ start:805 stop:1824 length:1020 start_codon:yes stop_codon:yes gene_type:complete
MKVLITGGAGYIGSHTIIEILESREWEIYSIDNFCNSEEKTFDRINRITNSNIKNFPVDVCDLAQLQDAFTKIGKIDGVIHFAALKAVGESVDEPLLYYHNNIEGLVNILKCCEQFNVPNLIFSSSCSIYGNVDQLPVSESTPMARAESPYASTKVMGEEIIEHFSKVSATKCTCLRYFNPVGAHNSGLIGENPINKPNNLIPVITQFASGIIPEMYVHGTDYDTRDGSCIRDYIHVSDIARAHVMALEYSMKQNKTFIDHINLGTGEGVSVLEAIIAFEKVAGFKLNYKIGPKRAGDVKSIYSDPKKAKDLLGWVPKLGIEEMMASSWKWQQNLNNNG